MSERQIGERRQDNPPNYYDAHVFICTNRRPDGHKRGCCAVGGSEKLRDYMKAQVKEMGLARVRVNSAGCLDRCEQGPCMVIYPEGVWYKIDSNVAVDEILQRHLIDGEIVPDRMLPAEFS